MNLYIGKRKSYVELNKIYFWTATIHKWQPLLNDQSFIEPVLSSMDYLSSNGKVEIYGFVLMPNHLHFIWKMIDMNGKESPHVSFLKYTAHRFKQLISNQETLSKFYVGKHNKQFEFWQRDSLAVPLYSKRVAHQKLLYIHNNPVSKKWRLAEDVTEYLFSSARFYETGHSHFSFLKNLWDAF